MPIAKQKIAPCLWFDTEAEDAAKFYTSIFDKSRILNVSRYTEEGSEIHGKKPGTVLVVEFEIEGQRFMALNGGPQFKFDEAVSFTIHCESQDEIDYYWHRLTEGGVESQCGWLKDRFGLSWQVTPTVLGEYLTGDPKAAQRVTRAFLQMRKFDIAALKRAYEGV